MKIRILLIEDEAAALKTLEGLISTYLPEADVVGHAGDIRSGIAAIREWKPDLVFLDMEIRGERGLQVLEEFPNRSFEVIITTAFSEFALPSYDFQVVDYLLKPLTPSLIRRGFERAKEKIRLRTSSKEPTKTEGHLLILPDGRDSVSVEVDTIIRVEARRNYSWLVLHAGKPILVSKTLALLDEQLQGFGFLRVHHSHLVNPAFIGQFQPGQNRLILRNQEVIPIARDRKKELKIAIRGSGINSI